jgi:hypothetical protein
MLNFAHKIDNAPFYQQADMVNQINIQRWAKLGRKSITCCFLVSTNGYFYLLVVNASDEIIIQEQKILKSIAHS